MSATESSYPKVVSAKYESGILNTSAVKYTFQNLNVELEHGFK